ncbi:cytochrome P450 [Fluviicoccus keumensis]|uniref:Cytochrome P450 n=1 Tax=Fluviicoccus keumensis TaxID=1435465 RepID=A0A4Q7ZCV5_9GAMM|nr:cytochrome P450 [Fluviicoccus keumensis]RZU48044.1 cytochrome P450 [Fluviicoccus keumensis]
MNPDLSAFPGDNGFPFIGHTLAFIRNPRLLAADRFRRHGEVSRVNIAGNRGVLLLGPDANEFLTLDREKVLSSRAAYEPFLKDTFPDALGLLDFDEHAHHRRILQSAFKKDAMLDYVDLLQDSAAAAIESWRPSSPFLFAPQVKLLLFNQAALLFMGESQGEEAARLIGHYTRAAAGTVALIRLMIPGTAYWRAVRSSLLLRRILQDKIPGKRANPGRDLFSHLCFARSEEGEVFTDDQIVKHMLGLMSAAHETTTSAIVAMAYALAKYPEAQERVRTEIREAVGDGAPSYEALDALAFTTRVFQECLRLWGSSHTMPRKALRDVVYKNYTIPAGTMVFISPSFVHRQPEFWTEPDRFDPERFGDGRKEHRQHRHLFMPFGGGAHKCIGMHLAELQLKIFFVNLLRRYRLALPDPAYEMKTKYVPVPESADGLPLLLTPV